MSELVYHYGGIQALFGPIVYTLFEKLNWINDTLWIRLEIGAFHKSLRLLAVSPFGRRNFTDCGHDHRKFQFNLFMASSIARALCVFFRIAGTRWIGQCTR